MSNYLNPERYAQAKIIRKAIPGRGSKKWNVLVGDDGRYVGRNYGGKVSIADIYAVLSIMSALGEIPK